MVDRRRIRNVVYYDYTSATIDYHVDLNAFAVSRADLYSAVHPHRLSLVLVATEPELGADRWAIEETIARALGLQRGRTAHALTGPSHRRHRSVHRHHRVPPTALAAAGATLDARSQA